MTICNMSIEGGARAGMIAPDETTFEYLKGREFAPKGADWDKAVAYWKTLPSDEGAVYDKSITLNASELEPMITYGTNPGMGMKITDRIPTTDSFSDAFAKSRVRKSPDLHGTAAWSIAARSKSGCGLHRQLHQLAHLRSASGRLHAQRTQSFASTRVMVVPGSQDVKKQAEPEGLDKIFKEAGAEWREAGCSMCIAMNGDQLQPGQYAVSTSNRNFEGRQGKGGRTFLASPRCTAAATAINGKVTDVALI